MAAVSAAAWFDFFFTPPYYRFTIRSSADITTAVLLLVVGVAVALLAARARRLQVIAITDAGYLAQIHQIAPLTQTAEPGSQPGEHPADARPARQALHPDDGDQRPRLAQ
jgi:Domain of unknown function (DUF4118)